MPVWFDSMPGDGKQLCGQHLLVLRVWVRRRVVQFLLERFLLIMVGGDMRRLLAFSGTSALNLSRRCFPHMCPCVDWRIAPVSGEIRKAWYWQEGKADLSCGQGKIQTHFLWLARSVSRNASLVVLYSPLITPTAQYARRSCRKVCVDCDW